MSLYFIIMSHVGIRSFCNGEDIKVEKLKKLFKKKYKVRKSNNVSEAQDYNVVPGVEWQDFQKYFQTLDEA